MTTPYELSRETAWFSRIVIPAVAWAMLLAFFAAAAWVSLHEPGLVTDAEPSVPMFTGHAVQLTAASGPSGAGVPDPAISAHEELDPVGVGHAPAL